MTSPKPSPDYSSQTAAFIVGLDNRDQSILGAGAETAILLEAAVCLAIAFTTDSEEPLADRFVAQAEGLETLESLLPDDPPQWDEDNPPKWLVHIRDNRGFRYIERSIGSSKAHRLHKAMSSDLKIVVPAIRMGLQRWMPVAYAFDSCARVAGQSKTSDGMLKVAATVDRALASFDIDELRLPEGTEFGSFAEESSLSLIESLADLADEASDAALRALEAARTPLIRKINGAREALEFSSDGVSQAANSLVEFIDRLFRDAFTEEETMDWIETHLPNRVDQVTYMTSDGKRRPSKYGRALCFVLAGEHPGEALTYAEPVARSIATTRRLLEELKHSDDIRLLEDQREQIDQSIEHIKAFLLVVFRFTWLVAPDASRDELMSRIEKAA